MYRTMMGLSIACSFASCLPSEKGMLAMNIWAIMFIIISFSGLFTRTFK